jgi:hypothetical protein
MKWDVIHVETIAPLALQVQFADGTAGKVQFEPGHLTGVLSCRAIKQFLIKLLLMMVLLLGLET